MKRSETMTRAGGAPVRALLWALGLALFVIALGLCWPAPVSAQPDAALLQHKAELEIQKLELEVKALPILPLLTALIGLAGGMLATLGAFWVHRLGRRGALTQAVHEKRLACYPRLVAAAAPFAVYFPDTKVLDPHRCRTIGQALRKWYFEEGGVLMSKDARDAYFLLSYALTRASTAETLAAGRFPNIHHWILGEYRGLLSEYFKLNLESPKQHDVCKWSFGPIKPYSEDIERTRKNYGSRRRPWSFRRNKDNGECLPKKVERALEVKDYVFLQQLASLLRTSLSADLHSRRRPN